MIVDKHVISSKTSFCGDVEESIPEGPPGIYWTKNVQYDLLDFFLRLKPEENQ